MANDIGLLVEAAMAMKQFGFVETLFKSLPAGIARSASFRERYKVFALFKWIHHGWRTEEPHLILATLQDNLPYSETESLVQQAAAQILKTKVNEGMSMAAFNKMIDVTFPEEHFDEAKRKLVDISAEFESPTKVIKLLAEKREDEFRRAVLELAARMERTLPTLKVEVEEPLAAADGDEDDERDERAEDEVTFTAADLREAFNGTLAEWEELVKQADPEVRAFVTRRAKGQHTPDASAEKKKQMTPVKPAPVASKAAPPPLPTSSTSSSAAPLAKKMLPPPPPLPTAAVAAAKRKTSEPAAKPEKKAAAKAAPASPVSGGSDGKRRRRFWAHEEELDLVRGVRKYGKGSWKKILQDETLSFSERSATDLKDKWRNLEKKKEEYEKELDEQSEGEEGGRPKARGGKGVKRQAEEMEEDDDERGKQDEHEPIEDSDVEKEKPVEVKREQAAAKKQAVSPNQIRESALEARNKRLQLLSNSNE